MVESTVVLNCFEMVLNEDPMVTFINCFMDVEPIWLTVEYPVRNPMGLWRHHDKLFGLDC